MQIGYVAGPMRPIASLPVAEARKLYGLLFDLDDTLFDHGALTPPAFEALQRLASSGLVLLGVTGRPASWAQVLTRLLPIAGMVAENGAIAVAKRDSQVTLLDRLTAPERKLRKAQLDELALSMLERFPDLRLSNADLGRVTDVAFDVAEHQAVPLPRVKEAIAYAEEQGARTLLSSIHLHISYDIDDKASGTLRLLEQLTGIDTTMARARYAFIGDSGNDAAAFAAFATTIGVQNLTGAMTIRPRYQTLNPRGLGFAEATEVLLRQRGR